MFKFCTGKEKYVEIVPKPYILANFSVTLLKDDCVGLSWLKIQQLNPRHTFLKSSWLFS